MEQHGTFGAEDGTRTEVVIEGGLANGHDREIPFEETAALEVALDYQGIIGVDDDVTDALLTLVLGNPEARSPSTPVDSERLAASRFQLLQMAAGNMGLKLVKMDGNGQPATN